MARIRWAALCVAVFACVYSFPLAASEPLRGSVISCDTAEQVKMVGSLVDEGKTNEEAMTSVNADAGTTACAVIVVVYVRGEPQGDINVRGKDCTVYQIEIIGVSLNGLWMQVSPPHVQYAPFLADGRPA